MHRTLTSSLLGMVAAAGTLIADGGEAKACGGCFTPPENPTVVTDHRMILSISKEQSTLYDQIRYQGEPSAFAWVLPVSGTVEVGLSADVVFSALDGMTQTRINPPPRNCPPRPDCDDDRSASFGAAAPNESGDPGGVTVTKREVVGPYETVQLRATDPTALQTWLATNNFNVPPDVKPVVDQYVAEKFDFLALKLIPGKGVQDMRPVRVTTKGAAAVLPLRMVAAGTGPIVGISLWVIGEGRYEAQNFPSFYIPTDEIAWDWTQNKSNYIELRAQRTTAGGGRAWETESSTLLNRGSFEQSVQYGYFGGGGGGGVPSDPESQAQQAYLPVKDEQGVVIKTAQQVRAEDMSTLFYGIPSTAIRATRMRSDLAHAALDVDLVMTASQDQAVVSNIRQVTKEIGEPLCPVWDGCRSAGQAPRSEAQARANGGSESFSCTAAAPKKESPVWIGLGAGFLAIAIGNAVRRHRRG